MCTLASSFLMPPDAKCQLYNILYFYVNNNKFNLAIVVDSREINVEIVIKIGNVWASGSNTFIYQK